MKELNGFAARVFAATFLLVLGSLESSLFAAPGDVDLSFDAGSGVNGGVGPMVLQRDGKLIIGGSFSTVRGLARANLARLNADGSGDPTFDAGTNADQSISAGALQSDGKVIVTPAGPNSQGQKVVRLNTNGTLDTSFVGSFDSLPYGNAYTITCVAVQDDGRILVGGYSTHVDGFGNLYPSSLLIRLDANGAIDNTFTNDIDGTFGGMIDSIALQPDGKILIAGSIGVSVNGTTYHDVARLKANGAVDTTFQFDGNGIIHSMGLQSDGKILVAGYGIGNGTKSNGVARLNADGTLDETFQPGIDANSSLSSVVVQADEKVICLGGYIYVGGTNRNGLVRLNSNGGVDESFNPATGAPNNAVATIALQPDGKILIAGGFTLVNGTNREHLARLNGDGTLDAGFDPGSSINAGVNRLALQSDGKLIIGGDFTMAGGATRNRLARLNANGTLDIGFEPGAGPAGPSFGSLVRVSALTAQPDGKVLVGGDFNSFNGISRNRLARLNADGNVDANFVPWIGAPLNYPFVPNAFLLQLDGKVLVGGNAALSFGSDGTGLARLNSDGSLDTSFHADTLGTSGGDYAVINSLALQPDGKILAGGYYMKSVVPYYLVTRLDANGSRDASFPAVAGNGIVASLALQPDAKILVASGWDDFAGWMARLNSNGSVDSTFNGGSGANNFINSVLLQPDGKILIAGSFTNFNGTNCNHVARLNADGRVDANFNVTASVSVVRAAALQSDGNLLIAGSLITTNGAIRPVIARLLGDAHPAVPIETWAQRFHQSDSIENRPLAIAVDRIGNAVVTGTARDTNGYKQWVTVSYSNFGIPMWTNLYHGPADFYDDQPNAIAMDKEGNAFVAGVSFNETADQDYAIIKYSTSGETLWTRRYNGRGNGNDGATGMAVDNAGNVIVTGLSIGVNGLSSFFDYATVKYTGDGVPLWTNRFNGPANNEDAATDMVLDESGNIFVTGNSYASNGRSDFLTVAYSSTGAALWTNRFNGPVNTADDYARAIAVDGRGNVFVTGDSWNGAATDYTTIKYSADGTPVWTNRFHGKFTGNYFATAMAVDADGNVFVTGGDGGFGSSSSGYATIKYSNAGMALWTNYYSAGFTDNARAVVVDSDGNVIVTGQSYRDFVTSDVVTVAYSNAGAPLRTNRFDGLAHGSDVPLTQDSLAFGPGGSVYVTSASEGDYSGQKILDFATVKYAISRPSLMISKSNASIILSWPVTAVGFQLQENSNLLFANDWTPVADTRSTNNNVVSVTLPFDGNQNFFRLSSP